MILGSLIVAIYYVLVSDLSVASDPRELFVFMFLRC